MNIQFLTTTQKVWVLICLPKCFWFITIFIWDRKNFFMTICKHVESPYHVSFSCLISSAEGRTFFSSVSTFFSFPLSNFSTPNWMKKHVLMIMILILTIAMSCLAAGFSTGVTSFRPLVSAPWIADSSSELGLHSDMVELGRLTRREWVILSNIMLYRRPFMIRGLISNNYLIRINWKWYWFHTISTKRKIFVLLSISEIALENMFLWSTI